MRTISLRAFVLVLSCCIGAVLALNSGFAAAQGGAQKSSRKSAPVYTAANPPRAGDEGVFYGPLTHLIDGDSFRARIQGVEMEFRLYAIDAPEADQTYGAPARSELRTLIGNQQLVIVFIDVDRYGRVIADLWCGDMHVNREMVARGAAHFYPEYARDNALFEVEQQARDAGRGLWKLPVAQRTEPWVWREHKRATRRPAAKNPR